MFSIHTTIKWDHICQSVTCHNMAVTVREHGVKFGESGPRSQQKMQAGLNHAGSSLWHVTRRSVLIPCFKTNQNQIRKSIIYNEYSSNLLVHTKNLHTDILAYKHIKRRVSITVDCTITPLVINLYIFRSKASTQ